MKLTLFELYFTLTLGLTEVIENNKTENEMFLLAFV